MTSHYIAYEGHCGVALAAMRKEYLPFVMPEINNLAVTAGVLLRPPVTLEVEEAFFDRVLEGSLTDEVFAILYKDPLLPDSEYIYVGHTGLHKITYPEGTASTGSIIVNNQHHHKGIGTEAKLLLLYHAFYVKGLRKITSEAKIFNGNSIGHLLKTGYQIIGRHKRHRFHEGKYVDELLFEVFGFEFNKIWKRYTATKTLPHLTEAQKRRMKEEM